jgi:hypothetical protein
MTFLPNGKWKLAKSGEGTPGVFCWHIKNGNLIQFRDGVTFPPEKMVWVARNQFYLEGINGAQSAPNYRHMGN